MRRIVLCLPVLCLLVGCGDDDDTATPPPPAITVTSPTVSTTDWVASHPATVTWTNRNFGGNVDIEYSTDAGANWELLQTNIDNHGEGMVLVPDGFSGTLLVRVSASDGDAMTLSEPSGVSEEVTVTPAWSTGVELHAAVGSSEYRVAWGDYDSDGTPDLILQCDGPLSRIYHGKSDGTFEFAADLSTPLEPGNVAWGDYDNDGDLDLAICGMNDVSAPEATVYRNDNGVFTDLGLVLTDGTPPPEDIAWADYDNDGDLDLIRVHNSASEIYANDQGAFSAIGTGLPGGSQSDVDWGDYDGDGDLDIALCGQGGSGYFSAIYRNQDGVFTDIGAGLTGVSGDIAWADYDQDGDLDLALTGHHSGGDVTAIYRNDNGLFEDTNAKLAKLYEASLAWGDYDNDGDEDLLVAGLDVTTAAPTALLYRNDAGTWAATQAGLRPARLGDMAWADCDNDGDLDVVIAGDDGTSNFAQVFINNAPTANTPPDAPTGLSASTGTGSALLYWEHALDVETPTPGLSYNLWIGKPDGASTQYTTMSTATGQRLLPTHGPVRWNSSYAWWPVQLPAGLYEFRVQSIDSARAGSEWSERCLIAVP